MGWRGLYEGVGLDLALACRGRWVRRILSRVKVRLRWVLSANTGGHGFRLDQAGYTGSLSGSMLVFGRSMSVQQEPSSKFKLGVCGMALNVSMEP